MGKLCFLIFQQKDINQPRENKVLLKKENKQEVLKNIPKH